ncbi:MAG: VOC family protein [Acidimicrobiales bacterium]|nr:VOC family protein [Acidimicrobiales bacterium]
MAVALNHTIVAARDAEGSARWAAELLGLSAPVPFGHFWVLETANGVSLDFSDHDGEITSQHYAFLVSEDDFDQIFGRIAERRIAHWADPGRTQADSINHNDGGRGVYFASPDGHLLEIITRPYGSSD